MEQITREEMIGLLGECKEIIDMYRESLYHAHTLPNGELDELSARDELDEHDSALLGINRALKALRAAEPVAWQTTDRYQRRDLFHTEAAAKRATIWHDGRTKIAPLFTLPALPELVPEAITDPADSCEVSSLFDHGYKRGWNACRDAMLSAAPQPERIEATDEILDALTSALAAMEHMGDVINGMDAVEDEDEKHFPAFHKVRAVIAKITASPAPDHAGDSNEMPGWEPIETAPMDGTHIQLYRPKIQFIGYYGGANSGWRHNAPGLDSVWPLPTHWMPLPNPPQQEEAER